MNKRRFIFEAQTIQEKNEWLNVLKSKMNNNNKCLSSLTFQTDDGNNINGLIVIDDDTIVTFGNIYIIYIDINIIIYSITINTSIFSKTHQFQKKQKYFH